MGGNKWGKNLERGLKFWTVGRPDVFLDAPGGKTGLKIENCSETQEKEKNETHTKNRIYV